MSELKPALINSDIIHELFRVSSSLLAVVDKHLRFQIISPAYGKYFVESNDDIIGQTVEAIYDTSQFDKVRDHYERALKGEKVTTEVIFNYPRKGLCKVRLSLIPHYNEQQKLTHPLSISSLPSDSAFVARTVAENGVLISHQVKSTIYY